MQIADRSDLYDFEHPRLLIVISGTSGSGKDSVAKAVARKIRERGSAVHFVVTTTSRPKRETEVEGIDYFFVSKSEFKRMIAEDELVEYALVYDQYKGVPKKQIRKAMAAMDSGEDVIMRLDIQGAARIHQLIPEAILVFLTASSEQELAARLTKRDTESSTQLKIRLQTARQEMSHIPEFDYVIPNPDGKLEQTVETVLSIMTAEKHRTQPRRATL